MITIGDPVPDMALRTDEGTPLALPDLNGRAFALFLLGPTLQPNAEMLLGEIADTTERFLSMEVSPIAVIGESVERLAEYRKRHDPPFLLLSDGEMVMHRRFRSGDEDPATAWIVDRQGRVVDIIPSLPSSELVHLAVSRAARGLNAPQT